MKIIEHGKSVIDLVRKMDNVELYREIVDLQAEIVDLASENADLKTKIAELKNKGDIKKKIEFKPPFFFFKGDKVALCPKCWQVDERPVYLEGPWIDDGWTYYNCPGCGYEKMFEGASPFTS